MKQRLLLTFSSLSVAAFMTACTGQMASSVGIMPGEVADSVGLSPDDKEEQCMLLDKKLMKVDNFLITVNKTSAFHLEEAATAIPRPDITVSNNKKQMLKDGNKRKAELEAEHKKIGCPPLEK